MVIHASEILKHFCNEIILSTNNPEYYLFGYKCVSDQIKGIGPLAGITSALREAKFSQCLVLACDMPEVKSELFKVLMDKSEAYDAVVPVNNGFVEALAAIYNKSSVLKLENMQQKKQYKMIEVLKNLNTNYVDVSDLVNLHPELFWNINYSTDIY